MFNKYIGNIQWKTALAFLAGMFLAAAIFELT
jgi:hypothetical protein